MAEMSPLLRVLMGVLHKGSLAAGVLLAIFAGILLWQRWTPEGLVLQQGDSGFLIVLGVLFLLALYLVRAIRKEIDGGN